MNPIELPAAGLHYGVPFEDYQKWPAANFSTIKEMRGTASKCKYAMDNPKKPTPAMILGSALHVATLEPARFDGMFHICPPCDGRTSEGKEILAENKKLAGDKLMLRQGLKDDDAAMGQLADIRGMAKSIRSRKSAAPFLECQGQNEVSALWKDSETGIWCKARFDRYISKSPKSGMQIVCECKSSRDASEWGFSGELMDRGYAAQAAGYRHGLSVITGAEEEQIGHVFLVVENFAPFDAAEYAMPKEAFQTGYLQYRQWLAGYAACLKSGVWPGYPDGKVITLDLPKWAYQRNYDN